MPYTKKSRGEVRNRIMGNVNGLFWQLVAVDLLKYASIPSVLILSLFKAKLDRYSKNRKVKWTLWFQWF